MSTSRLQPTTDLATTSVERDDMARPVDPWAPRRTVEELDRDDRAREGQPLKDYFERMRERGLLE